MAKVKTKLVYHCNECGAQAPKWSGQCSECGAWNCIQETFTTIKKTTEHRYEGYAGEHVMQKLSAIPSELDSRMSTGIDEFDRVLGGGLVSGSVVMIGGDPGIGKSTLLLQAMVSFSKMTNALYITGEESLQQVAMRANRLDLVSTNLNLLSETNIEKIVEQINKEKPRVVVVDSIQTVYTDELQSAPGSVAQLRESTAFLVRYAKQHNVSIFLVGHVTKEGALAGPRVLEHMVDTVLYFEGDNSSRFRVLRSTKNRFGTVNEIGIFAMLENGLKPVSNPSAIFLSRHEKPVAGSVIMVTREGSRPLLVEVQALVDESHLGNPRRVTLGMEQNRLTMLLAVMHRHGGILMYDQDVFINIVGGIRVTEPAADLPILFSVLSSLKNRPIPMDWVIFGEVGLAGEIRPVQNGQERIYAAKKHGFKQVIIPSANAPKQPVEGMEIVAVNTVAQSLEYINSN